MSICSLLKALFIFYHFNFHLRTAIATSGGEYVALLSNNDVYLNRHLPINRLLLSSDKPTKDAIYDTEKNSHFKACCDCTCTCTEKTNNKIRLLLPRRDKEKNYCSKSSEGSGKGSFRFLFEDKTRESFCAETSRKYEDYLYDGEDDEGDCECLVAINGTTCPIASESEKDIDNNILIIPKYIIISTSSLSVLGSLWILIEILRDPRKRRLCYHRILFGLSTFDLVVSICYIILQLSDISQRLNNPILGLCTGTGFLIYWGSLCIPLYNLILGIYFFLSVNRGWGEQKCKTKLDRYALIVVPLVTCLIASATIPLKLYDPYHLLYCFPSIGKGKSSIFQWVFWINTLICAGCLTCLMGFLYRHVLLVLRQSNHRSFNSTSMNLQREANTSSASNEQSSSQNFDGTKKSLPFRTKVDAYLCCSRQNNLVGKHALVRNVRNMALLYTIPFTITWLIPVIWQIISTYWQQQQKKESISKQLWITLEIWNGVCLPLQGFVNFLIYIIPRFRKIRLADKSMSLCSVCVKSLGRLFTPRQNSGSDTGEANADAGADEESMIGDLVLSLEEANSVIDWVRSLEE